MAEGTELLISIDASGAIQGARTFKRSANEIAKSGKVATKQTQALGTSMKTTAKAASMLKAVLPGIGGALVLTSLIKQVVTFEETMSSVQAVTGAVGEQFEGMSQKARELGATTQFSASQAAEGMRFLGMAGFETNEIIQGIGPSLDLAKAGMLDLGQAADIVSNVMSGFGLAAQETEMAADVLAQTAASSNTSVFQLGDAMKYAAPMAKALGVAVDETAAYLGILANAGLQGSMGGTALAVAMQRLLDITPKGATALENMGLTVQDVNPELNSMTEIIQTFADAGLGAAEAAALFGARGAKGMLILTDAAKGANSELSQMLETTENSEGAAARMAAIMSDNLSGAFKELMSAVSEVYLQMGDAGMLGAMKEIVQSAAHFVQGLAGMNDVLSETEEGLTGAHEAGATFRDVVITIYPPLAELAKLLAIVAGMSALVALITAMSKAFTALSISVSAAALAFSPLTLALGAVAALFTGYSFVSVMEDQFHSVKVVITEVRAAIEKVLAVLTAMDRIVSPVVRNITQSFKNMFAELQAGYFQLKALNPFASAEEKAAYKKSAELFRQRVKDYEDVGAATQEAIRLMKLEFEAIDMNTKETKRLSAVKHGIIEDTETQTETTKDLVQETLKEVEVTAKRVDGYRVLADLMKDLADTAQNLGAQYDPMTALMKEYDQTLEFITNNMELLESQGWDVDTMLENVHKQFQDGIKQIQAHEEASYPWGAAWESAIKRIDDAFFDLWKSAFEGFDGFMDAMEDALKTFAAQTFHNIFTKPITEGMINMMKGGGFTNAAGGSGFSGFAGLGGYAKSIYGGYQSGGFGGAMTAAGAPFAGANSSITGFLQGGAGFMEKIGSDVGAKFFTGIENTFATAGGGNMLLGAAYTAGAGFAGAYAGREVFGNEGSTGWGATAGGIIGAATPLGVLGAGIGAFLGEGFEKVLGDIFGFGGKPGNNLGGVKFDLGAGTSEEYGIGNYDHDNVKRSVAVLDAIQMFAEALGGSDLQGQIEASSRGWIRYNGKKYKEVDDLISTIFNDMVEAADDMEPAFKKLLTGFKGSAEELYVFSVAMLDTRERIKDGGMSLENLKQELEDAENATDDLVQIYSDQADEVLKLAREFDNSAESAVALNQALAISDQMFVQMALAIMATKEVIETTITALIESLDPVQDSFEETVLELQDNIDEAMDAIVNATDPMTVENNVAVILKAWDALYGSMITGLEALNDASKAISTTLEDSIKAMERDTMSDSQLAASIEEEIQTLVDELPTLTDPAAIQAHVEKINSLTNEMWNMLPDEQKARKLTEFTTFLSDVNDVAQELLTGMGSDMLEAAGIDTEGVESIEEMMKSVISTYTTQLETLNTTAMTTLDGILDGISKKQTEVNDELGVLLLGTAERQEAAAAKQEAAADKNLQAANTPVEVVVTVEGGGGVVTP